MAADAAKAKTKDESEDATRSIVLAVQLLLRKFNRLIAFLNGGEAAVEYELSDGESINNVDSADPFYISFYTSIPMLITVPKALTERGLLSVKTVRILK